MRSRLSFHRLRPQRCTSPAASCPEAGRLRSRTLLRSALLLAACTLLDVGIADAADIPSWIQAQVHAPVPAHDELTDAALLYGETVLTVQPNGRVRRLERKVYRILRPDGRRHGIVRVDIDPQIRLIGLRAWAVPAQGKSFAVGDRDAVESSLVGVENGELMNDVRTRLLRIPAAEPGSVIGYELQLEERPYVMTDEWGFQETVPVAETRYTLQLPPGWSYRASWLNHSEVAPGTAGGGLTQWVLHDVQAIRPEEQMPPWGAVAGRLALSLMSPDGHSQGFGSWQQMGSWYLGLASGRLAASPQITRKVQELAAASPDQLGKIRALASFVQQDVRYVAIELGIGGFQPHAAAEVFERRYGDCKDKATLLSSMLREIGVESYYFVVNTVRGAVSPTTPPDLAFNHVILAIRLPAGVTDATLLARQADPKLGTLLYFDPTDPFTPFGRLSGDLQAGYGLLVTAQGGELVQAPQLAASSSGVQRTAKLTLDEEGTLRGQVDEIWSGDRASQQRQAVRAARQDSDRIKPVEALAASSLASFQIVKAALGDLGSTDRPFQWHYSLEAPGYAEAAGELLLVRPRVLGSRSSALLETREPRQYPIEFEGPEHDTDVFDIALPPGYVVDEIPPPVDIDLGFVAYHSKTESIGRTLRYSRTFQISDVSVPAAGADALKHFYRVIEDDERKSAVLRRAAAHIPPAPAATLPVSH